MVGMVGASSAWIHLKASEALLGAMNNPWLASLQKPSIFVLEKKHESDFEQVLKEIDFSWVGWQDPPETIHWKLSLNAFTYSFMFFS